MNATFSYSKNGSIQLIGNYDSPSCSPQSKRKANYSADVSLRQDLLKGKMSFSLRVTDVFNTRNYNYTTTGLNFASINTRYRESRILYAGLQFKINNYNKKAEKPLMNSDMQEEGFQ